MTVVAQTLMGTRPLDAEVAVATSRRCERPPLLHSRADGVAVDWDSLVSWKQDGHEVVVAWTWWNTAKSACGGRLLHYRWSRPIAVHNPWPAGKREAAFSACELRAAKKIWKRLVAT